MTRGIILFGHGSRDPLWRQPIESVAARLAGDPGLAVRCAWLELDQPDLATAARELVAQGIVSLAIVPMFLGAGRHAREDLPRLVQALRLEHPGLPVELRQAIGEDARVLDLLAQIAAESS
ncbi:MAG TPA: CbiX/SirB N-terminal domain-containing protein [Ramlibacter sp.]|nr:CbiX/SirB N-terminal domain-containing protein [Ramlibacter sp.]